MKRREKDPREGRLWKNLRRYLSVWYARWASSIMRRGNIIMFLPTQLSRDIRFDNGCMSLMAGCVTTLMPAFVGG